MNSQDLELLPQMLEDVHYDLQFALQSYCADAARLTRKHEALEEKIARAEAESELQVEEAPA